MTNVRDWIALVNTKELIIQDEGAAKRLRLLKNLCKIRYYETDRCDEAG